MLKDFKYLFAYFIPVFGWMVLSWQGWWTWFMVIFAFGILPLLDLLLPISIENHPESEEESRSKNRFFDFLLYLCLPIVWFFTLSFFKIIGTAELSAFEKTGMVASIGVLIGAMGINIAHELGHRQNAFDQFLAHLLLLPALYQHFFIEHNRGHHKYVSTDRDPASAKRNETVYFFWLRSIIGQIQSAWHLETERLEKLGESRFSIGNGMILYFLMQSAYLLSVGLWFGWQVVPYAVAIAVVAVLMLETVNYIEHYGLHRKLLDSGHPEPVDPRHSWNSDHEMGRIFLFELTRHSDHHFKSTRKFQVLRHLDESPQLPTGYPGSMLLALVPPLWFKVVHPRIEK